MAEHTKATNRGGVAWRRVGLFYGVAFGGAVVVAGILWSVHAWLGAGATLVSQLITAVAYMPMPLVAGLVTERPPGAVR